MRRYVPILVAAGIAGLTLFWLLLSPGPSQTDLMVEAEQFQPPPCVASDEDPNDPNQRQ